MIDHTPFLYADKSTDWIDAKHSLVVNPIPESIVLEGYQWKKSIEDEQDNFSEPQMTSQSERRSTQHNGLFGRK